MERTRQHGEGRRRTALDGTADDAVGRASLTDGLGSRGAAPELGPRSHQLVDDAVAHAHGLEAFDPRPPVQLSSAVGQRGDAHERHADEVAAAVVAGGSAEALLDRYAASAPAVQRTEEGEGAAGDEGPPPPVQLDPSLEALLDEIAPIPDTPTPETMTGTNSADNSNGRLTNRTQAWVRNGQSFSNASRRAAREPGGEGQVPQGSPRTPGSEGFTPRWALVLLAHDYPRRGSDLGDVEALTNLTCPFQTALTGEFAVRRNIENPTGAQITEEFRRAIVDMIPHLVQGQSAELMVNFQGHGQGGAIDGVDWVAVTTQEMHQIAAFARNHNIHVTFVLDTCTAGDAVAQSQLERGQDLGRRRDQLSAEGQRRLTLAGELWRYVRSLNETIVEAYARRGWTGNERGRAQIAETFRRFVSFAQQLEGSLAHTQGVDVGGHRDAVQRARENAEHALGETIDRDAIMELRRATVPAVSGLSNLITQLLEQVQAELGQSRSSRGNANTQNRNSAPPP
jgi:hypothetical protein